LHSYLLYRRSTLTDSAADAHRPVVASSTLRECVLLAVGLAIAKTGVPMSARELLEAMGAVGSAVALRG
jgi:hypothetical protein